jgi:hypothetical protein
MARNTYRIIETSTDYYYLLAKKQGPSQAQDIPTERKRKKSISYKPAASKPKTKEEVLLDECERMGEDSYVPAPKAKPKAKPIKKGLTRQQLQAIKEIQEQVDLISVNHERIYQIAQQTIDSIKASA